MAGGLGPYREDVADYTKRLNNWLASGQLRKQRGYIDLL